MEELQERIEELEDKVKELEGTKDTLEEQLSIADDDFESLQEKYDKLDVELDTAEGQIEELQDENDQLRKSSIFGDDNPVDGTYFSEELRKELLNVWNNRLHLDHDHIQKIKDIIKWE